ncbi:hypothetical protein KHO49_04760 [Pseudomonas sp. RC4D1]|uniref:hypothetical protein n=1 Tax=Pseudomonas sp. RC4D1 TaxID=2834407 RepID=UPI001BCFFEE0|nr:hypothetical protein [Pseudomonas sp. RC4D1]MBS7557668.1 hypothetical protein [Pseudomonas sp. RC4D1]
MWCDITSNLMTVTMIVSPFGSNSDFVSAANGLISWVKTTGPNRKPKKGKRTVSSDELDEVECAQANDILSRMRAHVENMERRQVIYKMAEITGGIEWAVYNAPAEKLPVLKPGNS